METLSEDVIAGQAAYTWWNLNVQYDLFVLWYSNRWVWKCPTRDLLDVYNKNVSNNHLDIGVGTGYYLAHCKYPLPQPRLALMDINRASLARAGNRAKAFRPEIYCSNILEPVTFQVPAFDSIGLMYLLHCLPGTFAEKGVVFDHIKPLMNPGATVFGATIVQHDVPVGPRAQKLMDIYNDKGFFSNTEDSMESLDQILAKNFSVYSLTRQGCVAKFVAR